MLVLILVVLVVLKLIVVWLFSSSPSRAAIQR
jgi:hypothetical protein